MSVRKTGEEIAQEVFARLARRSETEESEHARLTTFYFPRPDGSIGFSRYVNAKDSQAVSMLFIMIGVRRRHRSLRPLMDGVPGITRR